MARIKDLESAAGKDERPKINVEAAERFIKHSLSDVDKSQQEDKGEVFCLFVGEDF